MKAKLAKLIDVKSIMTLLLTVVFCVLALTEVISGSEFLTIFTVIVGFYFGTQSNKPSKEPATPTKGQTETVGTVYETIEDGTTVQPEAVMDTLKSQKR